MHLLASYRGGELRALPQNLPAGLYEAAARRGVPARQTSMAPAPSAIPRQFSGTGAQRTSSPLARQSYQTPPISAQSTGIPGHWLILPQEKSQYDGQFALLDVENKGSVTGEQAVGFFSNSQLPEDDLAQIWDLSDITQTGQLNRDEFAVAMYLIRQQRSKRGPIPSALPPNLIPPSMRRLAASAPQVTVPSSPPKPRSAADDLFGLDAFSTPAPQVAQSTGGSSVPQPATSSPPQSQAQSTTFKPFIPSSSFGQSISSHAIGASSLGSMQQSPTLASDSEDLLGDTDPEISKRLTQETTELANLSNQVSSLTNQMQDVKTKRVSTDQDLSQVNSQKREFEARLSQLRTAYEQEAREVKTLENRLAVARAENAKVQQDLAMVQHMYKGLDEQRQQIMTALEADQKENANLKERIRQVNSDTAQIKLQLEKMRSDARQQKGLVAINKKQLSTNETERERVKADLESATNEHDEATRELENTKPGLDGTSQSSAAAVISPAASTASQSLNPFFRRATSGLSERSQQNPTPITASPNHTAFDNFFGTSFPAPGPFTPQSEPPPPTTFKPSEPAPQVRTPDGESTPTSQNGLPSASQLPPPPPQSRQITSSFLPLRGGSPRAASPDSSVGVAPPASRFGDDSGFASPSLSDSPFANVPRQEVDKPSTLSDSVSRNIATIGIAEANENTKDFGQPSAPPDIPGAFPGDPTPVATPLPSAVLPSQARSSDDVFGTSENARGTDRSPQDEFDSAFAGFANKGKAQDTSDGLASKGPANSEFPPIQEFGGDDDSDSDSEPGFDDDFTGASPPRAIAGENTEFANNLTPARPNGSQPPTPNAQASPPTYDQTVSPAIGKGPRDSNQFPPEFTGLLPSREDPTSPEVSNGPSTATQAPDSGEGNASIPPASSSGAIEAATSSQPQTQATISKNAFDDFDNEFGDLDDAETVDDKGDEDITSHREGFDEFNPTFDSPVPSKATSSSILQDSTFHDFEASISGSPQGATTGGSSQPAASTQDWDALFAGIDTASSKTNANGTASHEELINEAFGGSSLTPSKPPLVRAISTGTEHDDPILKRLTGMGYPRDVSLKALEKFDYNLDKVRIRFILAPKVQENIANAPLQAADYLATQE